MPYVIKRRRGVDPETVGELTYQLTADCLNFVAGSAAFGKYAEVVAALECAKLEFYRRVMAAYEDRKCEENGDVY